ncbi:MAG: 16S rRNA (adenine(1518)-N(6)/adenine(1519)-N(6))-dimethyltransferase, partial [Alphaproteobacteria bacterium]|nr:16S rRNA (adenine(1518)-N(6)/adenine(1519)-N(6))-dimethyltransferase [Alphaproteobacteria bacterium]
IAALAGDLADCTVFEIGPGPGGLTRALLETEAAQIIAVEKDERCVAALADLSDAAQGRLRLVPGDALKTSLPALAPPPRAIVANLPYNVGTELLLSWLHEIDAAAVAVAPPVSGHGAGLGAERSRPIYRSLTLMFQAEVADRIAAQPHNKSYGRLSVIAQFCCDVKRVLEVPASAFSPPPKVASAVVHLTPRANRPKDIPLAALERVTAAAFGQRRKMLRSSLKPLGGEELLKRAHIDPELRAENLSLTDYETLAKFV